jgi:arylsulfatase A-like enzyme
MATDADPNRRPPSRSGLTRAARSRVPLLLIAGMAALACGSDPVPPETDETPAPLETEHSSEDGPAAHDRPGRILLISMDTVRADRVSGAGDLDLTPRLAEIAAEGVRFERFYAAASYTLPATMSIFTGRDPIEHGVWTEAASLAPGVPTLAEVLANAGYTPVGLHEGGYVAGHFGFDRGFQNYTRLDQRQVIESGFPALLGWIRATGNQPYFLFVHTYAAHAPYGGFERYQETAPDRRLPDAAGLSGLREQYPRTGPNAVSPAATAPDETRRLCSLYNQLRDDIGGFLGCGYGTLSPSFSETPEFERDRAALLASYDARIRAIDSAIGQIRDLLVDLGLWDDTLLIVTSDHGEAFFEHGLYQHDQVPFEEVLRVPLIISWPDRLRDGDVRSIDSLAWHLDLMPTLLGLADLTPPAGLRGMDLTPLLTGSGAIDSERVLHPAVFRMPQGGVGSVRRVALAGDEKYIEGHPDFGDADGLLFDLSETPDESANLREERPGRFRALAESVSRYEDSLERIPALHRGTGAPITQRPGEFIEAPTLAPQEEAALRALGYRE